MDNHDPKILLYEPHSPQAYDVHRSTARFRILACGRRWGKSVLEVVEAYEMCMDVQRRLGRPARGWIVAPTYDLAMEEWRHAQDILFNVIDHDKTSKQKKVMFFFEGSEVEVKSADSKDTTLRGAGLDFAIMAEAARIPREAWEQGVRPALSDKLGRAVFGSTPKGKNWFYELYLRGLDKTSEYQSWHLPSNSRPSFPSSEWETLRQTLPDLIFKQEFEAEFLEDSSAVFRGMGQIIAGEFQEPIANHQYLVGVDLARTVDFTVITVVDKATKHVVHFDRFNQLEWPFQKKRIIATAQKYNNAFVWLDSSGLGDPIEQDLRRADIRCQGIKFTNTSKKELIEFLSIAIEQKAISYPRIEILLNELSAYEYQLLPSGDLRYCAPQGMHDDCVISLALAVWGLKTDIYRKVKQEEKKPYDDLPLKDQAFWERWSKNAKPKKGTPSEVVNIMIL